MIALLVFLAGATGAVTRFVVDATIKQHWRSSFPLGTFVINVAGSALLGVLAGLVLFHGQPSAWQTIVGTGFCGGFTTFSTASFETVRLIQLGKRMTALANAIGTLLASFAACAAGLAAVWAL